MSPTDFMSSDFINVETIGFIAAFFTSVTYGLATMAWPLICANTVTITLASCILTIILQNKWKAGNGRRQAKTRLARMKSARVAAA